MYKKVGFCGVLAFQGLKYFDSIFPKKRLFEKFFLLVCLQLINISSKSAMLLICVPRTPRDNLYKKIDFFIASVLKKLKVAKQTNYTSI
jgi:hypothetical protein